MIEKTIIATIPLSKPIHHFGKPVTELSISEPTAGDIAAVGNPVKITSYDPLDVEINDAKMLKMIARLTGIDVLGGLDRMSGTDLIGAGWALAPFFIPGFSPKPQEQPANSPDITT